jgi:hypothetical protein
MRNPNELADHYVALWNEPDPDPDQRRQLIEELWPRTAHTSSSRPKRYAKSLRVQASD